MIKKYQKFACARICFFSILFVSVFCLFASAISAAQLEVQYPAVANQTITADTKLPGYVLYLFNAGMFLGFSAIFLSFIIAGVMWMMSPAKPDFLADAKDRISGAISGLLILVLTYLIITTINPQLSIFKFNELPAAPEPPPPVRTAGVYFYQNTGCPSNSNDALLPHASSAPDLGPLRNGVHSVEVAQGVNSYITILYDNINLWGRCQYINPNSSCTNVTPFAASASVHIYDFDPNGDGVYFFRKPCFSINVNDCKNNSGGYYEVDNDAIKNARIYIEKLENLEFQGIPQEEQDCIKYNEHGECTDRSAPTLGGENISSVRIKGSYVVLFVYFGPNDTETGIWTSCQEFPTNDDVNKLGPLQMKWQNIRNNKGVIPNYVVIIPVKS